MALGDYFVEHFELAGQKLAATPLVVEPVSDVAVLGALDAQEFFEEVRAYEDALASIKPISLSMAQRHVARSFSIHIFTHHQRWISGQATLFDENANSLYVRTEGPIEQGTSGGPAISSDGKLVGIVSTGSDLGAQSDVDPWFDGQVPRLNYALPVWVLNRIRGG